jgi:replicative DNA helicase Mcm
MTQLKQERTESVDVDSVTTYLENFPQPSIDTLYGFVPSRNPIDSWTDFLAESWDYKIKIFRKVWKTLPTSTEHFDIQGLTEVKLRDLAPEHKNQLIELQECRVQSVSIQQPFAEMCGYKCAECHTGWSVPYWMTPGAGGATLLRQYKFPGCCDERKIVRDPDGDTEHVKSQFVKLQELQPPKGEVPLIINVLVKDNDLVWKLRSNERIKAKGILRIRAVYNTKEDTTNYHMWLDIVSIVRTKDEVERDVQLSEDDIKYIKSEQEQPQFYEKLLASFCPHIKGMEPLKELTLLCLGSIKLEHPARMLVVADPAVGKSDTLMYAADLLPNSYYVAMNKASKTGLTTTSEQDKETNRWTVTPGLFPAAHEGLICVDELQLGKEEDFGNLNSVVSSGKVHYALAGGNRGTLDANCALLMACNPRSGRIDTERNIHELLKFMGGDLPQFLSRMNLVFFMKDNRSREEEEQIARHMYRNTANNKNDKWQENWKDPNNPDIEYFGKKWIRKILYYIINNVQVEDMPQEHEDEVVNYYLDNRFDVTSSVNKLTNRRLMNHATLLAQIKARLQGQTKPTQADIRHTRQLLEKNMSTVAFDPKTGEIDPNPLNGSQFQSKLADMDKQEQLQQAMQKAMIDEQGNNKGYFTMDDLIFHLQMTPNTKWKSDDKIENAVYRLHNDGKLMEKYGRGKYTPL